MPVSGTRCRVPNALASGTWHRAPVYQDALRTPGIMPDSASSLKQMRQRPKRRRYARERPHRLHRLCFRTENFGFSFDLSIFGAFAGAFEYKEGMSRVPRSRASW